jgi:hypothetical protein
MVRLRGLCLALGLVLLSLPVCAAAPAWRQGEDTMVALPALAAWLGVTVQPSAIGEYSLAVNGRAVTLCPDNAVLWCSPPDAFHSGEILAHPPCLRDGVLYVPLRILLEHLGGSVQWQARTGTAVLSHPAIRTQLPLAVAADPTPPPGMTGEQYIVTDRYLVGALRDGQWITGLDAARQRFGRPRACRFYALGSAQGTARVRVLPDAAGSYGVLVELTGWHSLPGAPRVPDDALQIGLSADGWNVLPRPVTVQRATPPAYQQALRAFLDARGLRHAPLGLTQVVRADLDGDGTEEVLLGATTPREHDGGHTAEADDYSVLLLRRLEHGQVVTRVIAGVWHPRAGTIPYSEQYRLIAALDLDHDGALELCVRATFHEGEALRVYKLAPDGALYRVLVGSDGV